MEIPLAFIILTLIMAMLVVTVLLVVFLCFRISKIGKNYSKFPSYGAANPLMVYWQYYWQSQSSTSEQIPFIANLLRICFANAYIFQREGIFFIMNVFTPYVIVYKEEYIKEVINSRVADDKSKDYIAFQPILGTGLLTSNGRKWRNRRKLIQPCVHMRNVENLIPIFNEHSLLLVDKLKKKENEPLVDAEDIMVACAMDIIF
ncbi:cytochrome P450 4V2-like, partial [Stegodyphus dumicola]|uniref:cytochrome P450 4V2-like n=1 Tax=Stegodyphus dumicola TaxID=202533 RepID=UPI0015AB44B0